MESAPTAIDLAYQVAFKVAHRMLRAYWSLTRPLKGGTLVAIWNDGEILLVKNTYRKQYTLPGGYPRPGETPAQTGTRELAEECRVVVSPDQVREVYRGEHLFEGRRDDVTIVEVTLPTRPAVYIDNREVEAAHFTPPDEVLKLSIVPHLRDYLLQRQAGAVSH
jgi:8-oxo-dGTP diphosphatase